MKKVIALAVFLVSCFATRPVVVEGKDCAAIINPEECVKHTEVPFVAACEWCSVDTQCHAVDSIYAPCPDKCCASESHVSTCHTSKPSNIPGKCTWTANNNTAYSESLSIRMARAAGVTYCSEEAVMTWSCKHCVEIPDISPQAFVTDADNFLQGFVGIDRTGSETRVVVAFRGTVETSIKNWAENLDVWSIDPYEEYPHVYVHGGFYNSYHHTLRAQIHAALNKISDDIPVIVTGHSLGGAIATICAFDLAQNRKVAAVYTYGQPRVGNFDFAHKYKELVPNHFRLTHNQDLVPHVPLLKMGRETASATYRKLLSEEEWAGFYHTPLEVYYPDDSLSYNICDSTGEDARCSNSCGPFDCTSVSDHLLYVGVALGSSEC